MRISGSICVNVGPVAEIIPLPGLGDKVTIHCIGPQPIRVSLLASPKAKPKTEALVIQRETAELSAEGNTHVIVRAMPPDSTSAHCKVLICTGN